MVNYFKVPPYHQFSHIVFSSLKSLKAKVNICRLESNDQSLSWVQGIAKQNSALDRTNIAPKQTVGPPQQYVEIGDMCSYAPPEFFECNATIVFIQIPGV